MQLPPRYNVLGTAVSALSLPQARDLVVEAASRRRGGYVCFATAYSVDRARAEPELRSVYNGSFLTTPDGMPLVWLGRWHGHRAVTRVYGPDLLLAVCDAGRAHGLIHYFCGAGPGVAADLGERLTARFPGLQVAGTHTPPYRPFTEPELAALEAEVAAKRPHVIWVGFSSPRQDVFMATQAARFGGAVLLGVGAAFDFHSGRVRQAPRALQRSGLEWLFRLWTEPGRLGRRYLVHNPRFVLHAAAQLARLRQYPAET